MTIDLTLSHGLNKVPGGQTITIFSDKVLGLTESPTMGVIVLLAGGVSLPVRETKQDILAKMAQLKQGENINGTTN